MSRMTRIAVLLTIVAGCSKTDPAAGSETSDVEGAATGDEGVGDDGGGGGDDGGDGGDHETSEPDVGPEDTTGIDIPAPDAPTERPVEDTSFDPVSSPDLTPDPGQSVTFIGAGDIAACSVLGYLGLVQDPHDQTAELLGAFPRDTPIFTIGDNVYSDGTALQFSTCFDKSWGQFRRRMYPAPGNHDYNTDDAEGYFGYFGERAGNPSLGYYSFDLGEWHILSLNSNCGDVPCDADSAQAQWVRDELEANDNRCVMAYWHHPRFSSDRAGSNTTMEPLYQALYDGDADLILVGHAHNYERFAPQTPQGEVDEERGIRQFVVGTGGADLRDLADLKPNSEIFRSIHGIMQLTLNPDSYDWRFISVGGDFTDTGSERCH